MKNSERAIFDRLSRRFVRSDAYAAGDNLFPETLVPISPTRVRIPDASSFTGEQIAASERDKQAVPSFTIEIISPNETGFKSVYLNLFCQALFLIGKPHSVEADGLGVG